MGKAFLSRVGISPNLLTVAYGVSVSHEAVSSLMLSSDEKRVDKAVYSFCDGFAEADREAMFNLVHEDASVKVFICSCGKGTKDKYNKPEKILQALNHEGSESSKAILFKHKPKSSIVGHMYSSGSSKKLELFSRC